MPLCQGILIQHLFACSAAYNHAYCPAHACCIVTLVLLCLCNFLPTLQSEASKRREAEQKFKLLSLQQVCNA
jgi:hypothetical protein